MTKAKKLPDVWVASIGGKLCAFRFRREAGPWNPVRYTPAKPAKVCVWTQEEEFMRGACERSALYPYGFNYVFCPLCKGKIKVTR